MTKINKPVVIVDIDGTLADVTHRLHYITGDKKKDWKSFFANVHKDPIRWNVVVDIDNLYPPTHFSRVLVSGRSEDLRQVTEKWLTIDWTSGPAPFIAYDALYMRKKKDNREDVLVKKDIYDEYLKHHNVVAAFEDRPRLVRLWESLGIKAFNVGNGVEF